MIYLLKHKIVFFSFGFVYDRYKQNKMFKKTWLLSKRENGLVTCQKEEKTHLNIRIFQQKLACGVKNGCFKKTCKSSLQKHGCIPIRLIISWTTLVRSRILFLRVLFMKMEKSLENLLSKYGFGIPAKINIV